MSLTDRTIASLQSPSASKRPANWRYTPAEGKPVGPDAAFPFTAASGTDLLTTIAHGLAAGERIWLSNSGGALPAPLAVATDYYVSASGLTADAFKVSTTLGGSYVNITSVGTGTHTWQRHLTEYEQAEVAEVIAFFNNGAGMLPTIRPESANAIAYVQAHFAYWNRADYLNWWHDDQLSGDQQWLLRRVDVNVASAETVPASATATGVGSGAVTVPVLAADGVPALPSHCEPVELDIDSGTLGGSISLGAVCTTLDSVILYRTPPGAGDWIVYTAPVSMAADDELEAKATAPGFLESDVSTFTNSIL
jgi:hypothetical protein